jgi:hypothetical protein
MKGSDLSVQSRKGRQEERVIETHLAQRDEGIRSLQSQEDGTVRED